MKSVLRQFTTHGVISLYTGVSKKLQMLHIRVFFYLLTAVGQFSKNMQEEINNE